MDGCRRLSPPVAAYSLQEAWSSFTMWYELPHCPISCRPQCSSDIVDHHQNEDGSKVVMHRIIRQRDLPAYSPKIQHRVARVNLKFNVELELRANKLSKILRSKT